MHRCTVHDHNSRAVALSRTDNLKKEILINFNISPRDPGQVENLNWQNITAHFV